MCTTDIQDSLPASEDPVIGWQHIPMQLLKREKFRQWNIQHTAMKGVTF